MRKERYDNATEIAIGIIDEYPQLGQELICITGTMAEAFGYADCAHEVIESLVKQRDEANEEVRKLREKLMRRKS